LFNEEKGKMNEAEKKISNKLKSLVAELDKGDKYQQGYIDALWFCLDVATDYGKQTNNQEKGK
jgi:hypothetical protein